MALFDSWKPFMTDATVPDPDNSESELVGVNPDENVTKEEKDPIVDFPDELGTEAIDILKSKRLRIKSIRDNIANKINKLVSLNRAVHEDMRKSNGHMPRSMRIILEEEGIISTDTSDDAEDANKIFEEYEDKGATEEELVKASLRAQYNAFMYAYKLLKKV